MWYRGRGEDGWGIYIQSVACRVLHVVESSAICFLQIIQQLKDEPPLSA